MTVSKALTDKIKELNREIKNLKENYDNTINNLKAENKKLKDILKDFMETKEDLRTWKYEMAATIEEVLK